MYTPICALKYAPLCPSFDCWEDHAVTFGGGELPVDREQTTGVKEQKRTTENSRAEPELQHLWSGPPFNVFLWQRWRKSDKNIQIPCISGVFQRGVFQGNDQPSMRNPKFQIFPLLFVQLTVGDLVIQPQLDG